MNANPEIRSWRSTCLISGCIVFLLVSSGSGAQPQARVTGFFSDMHYVREAGDVLGTEVWIAYGGDRYYATVQIAEGSPSPPVVVPVEVSGSRVKFTVREKVVDQNGRPAPDLEIAFDGTVTRSGLSGTMSAKRFDLKRRNSYWQ